MCSRAFAGPMSRSTSVGSCARSRARRGPSNRPSSGWRHRASKSTGSETSSSRRIPGIVGFVIDLFCCAATSGVCVAIWLLTAGSVDKLNKVIQDPTLWRTYGFWPVWVLLGCAAILTVHLGVVLAIILFGGRARRRRKELAREARKAARELHRHAHEAKRARREDRASPP